MASPTSPTAEETGQPAPFLTEAGKDLETGGRLQRSTSRASIPGTPTPLADRDADATEEVGEEEYVWGPSHPCFPHLNPHVPVDSPLYESTRIIRIKRDWMQVGDLAPTFANLYPEVLDPLVLEEDFRKVVRHINTELIAAFSPWSVRAWADAILGAATLWLYDDLGLPAVKRRLAKLEKWIEEWNRNVGEKEGVHIIPLRRTAYMTLDFQIPDPHISMETNGGLSRPPTAADRLNPNLGEPGPYPVSNIRGGGMPHDGQTHLPIGVQVH